MLTQVPGYLLNIVSSACYIHYFIPLNFYHYSEYSYTVFKKSFEASMDLLAGGLYGDRNGVSDS